MTTQLPPAVRIIEECILQLSDPSNFDKKRVLAMARVRYTQLGGDPEIIKIASVYRTGNVLRRKLGNHLTKDKLEKYLAERNGTTANASTQSMLITVELPSEENVTVHVPSFKAAQIFVKACGGYSQAKEALNQLEDLLG